MASEWLDIVFEQLLDCLFRVLEWLAMVEECFSSGLDVVWDCFRVAAR